jgi:uncharacterized damage-inducible protein DinB
LPALRDIFRLMNTREHFTKQFKKERKIFSNVIRAMPADKLDYKPHERNSSAGDIAWFLVLELRTLVDLAKTFEHHWDQKPNPKSVDAIASAYEAAADDMEKALASMDDARWEKESRMYFNGKLMKTAPLGETIWDFFFDTIHHRGQITAYLRPMGGKVPSTYGPSGDSK